MAANIPEINSSDFQYTLQNPAGETILKKEDIQGNPRIIYFKSTGETRKFYFTINRQVSHFIHFNSTGDKIYTVLYGKNQEYAVFFYNSLEWLTRLIYYKANGNHTVTIFRRMKRAVVIEYDKSGSILSQSEY